MAVEQNNKVQGRGYMKTLYTTPMVEVRLISRDVITASIDDPEADNDQVQDDGIFG